MALLQKWRIALPQRYLFQKVAEIRGRRVQLANDFFVTILPRFSFRWAFSSWRLQ